MSTVSWDGWVLYTSEEGYKYYWNHLTHESRCAAEEPPAQDRDAEVCIFFKYLDKSEQINYCAIPAARRLASRELGD